MIKSSKKTLLCLLAGVSLSACTTSTTEKEILQSTATNDAKKAPKELHLGYLNCYALSDVDKKNCRSRVGHTHKRRANASSWDYILPFDYEAERQGFAAFLRDQGKACDGVNDGPKYDPDKKAYVVNCTGGQRYLMRFDRNKGEWQLVG